MNEVQAHRGPDASGSWEDPDQGVSLAMSRLTIIDAAGGEQPMTDEVGDVHIVFNGEIFNAPALRRQLEARGHMFRSDHSDTEVVLRLYLDVSDEMPRHLNGMFAFVIHDRARRRLFGARDRCGIKPLHYSTAGSRFAFASEIKSLLVAPWIDRKIDRQAAFDYFGVQAVPAPRTMFSAIRQVPPATGFTVDLTTNDVMEHQYWTPARAASPRPTAALRVDVVRQLREQLEQAVLRWAASDVPVACSLSGGIDSSAITGLLASATGVPPMTYTVGFDDDKDIDERDNARLVAQRWRSEHHEVVLTAGAVLDALPRMVSSLDGPYAGGLPSWFVFEAVARDAKVVLTGVGGDELFGNYGKWRRFPRRSSAYLRALVCEPSAMRRWPHGSLYYPRIFSDHEKRQTLFVSDVADRLVATEQIIETAWLKTGAGDPREAITHVDLGQQLSNEFLFMVDRFSMAHSVEARTPFLDSDLVDFLIALPAKLRSDAGASKQLLLDAVHDLIPTPLLTSPKRGFVIPASRWLRNELRHEVEDLLNPDALSSQGLFQEQVWHAIVQPHLSGAADETDKVWTLFMFQKWWHTVGGLAA